MADLSNRTNTELKDYIERLESVLYECVLELSYVQSVENCNSGLCATGQGKRLVEIGMNTLGVTDLSKESLKTAVRM